VPFDPREFLLLAPEILLSLAGLLLLLVGTMGKGFGHRESALVSIVALVLTGWVLFRIQAQVPVARTILGGMFVIDGYAFVWKLIVLLATAVTVLLSVRFLEEGRYRPVEYYALLLLATAGMLFMASGATLLTIWIALETMALASYILAGYFKREVRSTEAALKYFILGAMSSGVLLYGISLLYGAAGTVSLAGLARELGPAMEAGSLLVPLGWLLLAAGLFFKVAAVPFHVWTPDV